MSKLSKSAFAASLACFAAAAVFANGAAVPAPAPAAGQSAADRKLVEEKCSGCHEFSDVSSQSRTAVQWAATIKRMVGNGASISAADQKRIQDFLTAHYGPKK